MLSSRTRSSILMTSAPVIGEQARGARNPRPSSRSPQPESQPAGRPRGAWAPVAPKLVSGDTFGLLG